MRKSKMHGLSGLSSEILDSVRDFSHRSACTMMLKLQESNSRWRWFVLDVDATGVSTVSSIPQVSRSSIPLCPKFSLRLETVYLQLGMLLQAVLEREKVSELSFEVEASGTPVEYLEFWAFLRKSGSGTYELLIWLFPRDGEMLSCVSNLVFDSSHAPHIEQPKGRAGHQSCLVRSPGGDSYNNDALVDFFSRVVTQQPPSGRPGKVGVLVGHIVHGVDSEVQRPAKLGFIIDAEDLVKTSKAFREHGRIPR